MGSDASFYQLSRDPIAIDWAANGDRLLHLLLEELPNEIADLQGYQMGWTPPTETEPAYFDFFVTSRQLTSHLCIIPLSNGSALPLIRINGDAHEGQFDPWERAFSRAIQHLDDEQPAREWWAVIGATTDFRADQALRQPVELGGLTLTPSQNAFEEMVESVVPSMGSWSVQHSYPVVVHGANSGYSFPVTQEAAADRLGRLCAALSIAWDGCWQIRQSPQQFPLDPARLPRSRTPSAGSDESGNNWSKEEVDAPDWLETALEVMKRDGRILTAARAHHQGMMMEVRSPSYALLAYVAAIEGIGARYVSLEKCKCCTACTVTTGAARRFRSALGMVLPPEDVKRISKAYTHRSLTAHEGQLHGGEDLFGALPEPRVFSEQESRYFRHQRVWPLRNASRQLLLLGLTGRLPEPSGVADE
jgi:hypothetical protein